MLRNVFALAGALAQVSKSWDSLRYLLDGSPAHLPWLVAVNSVTGCGLDDSDGAGGRQKGGDGNRDDLHGENDFSLASECILRCLLEDALL